MRRFAKAAFFSCIVLLSAAPGGKPPVEPAPPEADISKVKDQLAIIHDGKGHYVAFVPFGSAFDHLYYGDGKIFYNMRVRSGSSTGRESWHRSFWEPRAPHRTSIEFTKDTYTVHCDDRKTKMEPLDPEATKAMLETAKFYEQLWNHEAYCLARDNSGRYYYVDRARKPENSKAFRLFAGPRGNMKPLKMVNVVSDSQGDIFATKTGQLRLVIDKKESLWIQKKSETKLQQLPIDDNVQLIYADLGVYAGQRLGTPCDDL